HRLIEAWGDAVDVDVVLHQDVGHVPGEHVQAGFGGGVGEVVEVGDRQAADGSDVHHRRRSIGGAGGAKGGKEVLGEEEGALDVEIGDAVPRLLTEVVDGGAPAQAGVVDEDVEVALALRDLAGQRHRTFEGGEVAGHGDA